MQDSGQVNSNWGDPNWVQQFRTKAISSGQAGIQQVDAYIKQYQDAYAAQAGHQVQGAIGANQGGMTPGQAQQDPVAALSFIQNGGQLVNTGPDAQAKILSDAGKYFDSHANKKTGFIDPQTFNKYLAQYGQAGGDSKDFTSKLGDKYIDPNNIGYDTPDAKQARSTLPIIKQVIDSYHKLQWTGQAAKDVGNIPVIGPYIQQNYLAGNVAHDKFLTGEIGNIRSIAGAGSGQGFRFNLNELNNIAGLLPQSGDNKAVANKKLTQLDTFLKTNMGVQGGLKSLYGK